MMYWSDWGVEPRIEKASMDGANRTVLHNTRLRWPNALTLDIFTQTLYWADASFDKVESSNADGTNRQLLIQTGIFHPFSIAVTNNEIYFSDWGGLAIFHVNETEETALPLSSMRFCSQPSGLIIVDQLKQLSSK